MTGRWLGTEPLEVLLSVGLGVSSSSPPVSSDSTRSPQRPKKSSDENDFSEFDPDDMPDLDDAVKILFPSLREVGNFMAGTTQQLPRREGAELEYELEMMERINRVCLYSSVLGIYAYFRHFSSTTYHQVLQM